MALLGCEQVQEKTTANSVDTLMEKKVDAKELNPFITRSNIEDGEYEERYPNGVLKVKGIYSKGKRHGTWMSFYEDGTLWSEGSFVQGKREGRASAYHPNGKLYYEGFYTNGKPSGVWTYYDANGIKVKEADNDK